MKKPGSNILRLIAHLRAGKTLCVGHIHSEVGDAIRYWLEPGGRSVGCATVKRALDRGVIIANGDALLPDDTQTYKLAQ